MRIPALLLAAALLPACSTHPITGREQILALPSVQAAYAEAKFAAYTVAQALVATPSCAQDCERVDDPARFARRIERIGAQLEPAARALSPDLEGRIGSFRIELSDTLGVGTAASAGGRIALGAGLAGLEPTDAVLAFLIAREMAHVIARHGEENSGASLLFTALGAFLPGVNVILRFAATTLGSNALVNSWALQQQREADRIAVALLWRIGLSVTEVADSLEIGVKHARLPDSDWGARYLDSLQHVAWIATSPAQSAQLGS
jgi:Zn-dependent protease with chaperone function